MRHVPPKAGGLPVPHAISIALGGFNPVEKYDRQIWIISPGRGQNKKCVQSPPSYIFDVLLLSCNTILTYSLQKPIAAHDRNSQTLAKLATINTKGLIHPRILLDVVKAGAFVGGRSKDYAHGLAYV